MNGQAWASLAFLAAAGAAAFAWRRAARPETNYYASQVYGLSAARHRQFAWLSTVLAAVFLIAIVVPAIPIVPVLGVYVVVAILYFSSFLRGATGEDE